MITVLAITMLLATSKPAIVGEIQSTKLTGGCGCRFWRSSRSPKENIFFSEGSGRPALLNLNGKDVWLGLTTPEADDDWGTKTGDKSLVKYAACDYSVDVHRTLAPSDCPDKVDGCEYVNMKGTLVVRVGEIEESIPITGACGC